MKNFVCTLICFFCIGIINVSAESNVYLFTKAHNSDIQVYSNGVNICDLNGPVKKTMDGGGMFQIPYRVLYPTYRKLVFAKEGKVVISVEYDFVNCMNLKHTVMKCEIQLDLEEGQTYYVELTSKGLHDVQLKSLTEKKALKNINNKKWRELPSVAIE